MKLIDKDTLLAEIENIITDETESVKCFERGKNGSEVQRSNARMAVLVHIRSLLNTLDVKEVDLDFTKEPVIEDLDKAAIKFSKGWAEWDYASACFKSGANWQKEQFEKNRLAACDKQTEEEADIESDFVMNIIKNEHRQPTFDDAIKYGMRLQKEQMMAKAIDGEVGYWNLHGLSVNADLPSSVEEGDKVKVIAIKEE